MAKGNGKKDPLETILEEMKKGFEGVNQRLDAIITNTGAHYRELKAKVDEHDKEIARLKRKAG